MTNSIGKLVDAICEAWTKCLPPPYGSGEYSASEDGQTDCNRFVIEVCNKFGYTKLNGLKANQMYDELVKNGDWILIPGDTAQFHSNSGVLVIAAWKNPDLNQSGHVCLVRPGIAQPSQSWGLTSPSCPMVANVGQPGTCRIDRKASFAFGKDKIPHYFALKSMMP